MPTNTTTEKPDGIDRNSREYITGYLEALHDAARSINVSSLRCKRVQAAGLELAFDLIHKLHSAKQAAAAEGK